MDDYALWSIILLVIFIIIDGLFYGFGAAIQLANEMQNWKKKTGGG